MVQGVLIDEAVEMLFEGTRHFARASRTGAVQQALRSLLGKALHPLAEGGVGKVERRRDGVDVRASHALTHRLRPTKHAGLLRLLQYGRSGCERFSGTWAFEGTHRMVLLGSHGFYPTWTRGSTLLIGAKWLRLTFFRFR